MNRSLLLAAVLPFAIVMAACTADTSDPSDPSAEASPADDETDTTSEELSELTYTQTKPIIDATCGGCHASFKTLAGIKPMKARMKARIQAGSMPRGNPTWKNTTNGKKVLRWLTSGRDLR